LILDTSHPQIALEGAAVRNAAAVGGISNSMGHDTFVFSENVRHHAGGSKTAGSTDHDALQIDQTIAADVMHLAVCVVEHDGAIDASVTPTGMTSLPANHLLFT
jgi:hypothetical protein